MRIRIRFLKSEMMRYTGHLDLFRSWERAFRRSGLPLAYSKGFHPGPRLNLACALPLGFTSEYEILDAWLECSMPLADIRQSIEPVLPPGLTILDIELIDAQLPALQTKVMSSTYVITFLDAVPDLDERINRIISAKQLLRQKRGKQYDLRQLIEALDIISPSDSGNMRVRVQLSAREAATGRPEELLDEMGIRFEDVRVHRDKLILRTD